jgi:hypothetical protein
VSGILKDEAIALLKKFYTSENPRGTCSGGVVACVEQRLTGKLVVRLQVEDSKKKRKKRDSGSEQTAVCEFNGPPADAGKS